ncbi:ribonuclease D [Kozakia baliensis]|uniref:ribonuclease D n=1 Tax=Kozakia baliensis TaxID=153496 RepID=UPI00087CD082|nr:ribonuclease D [Kozakia baliensis]AOX20508.1 ribonuclease D [Kozakia baliensis]
MQASVAGFPAPEILSSTADLAQLCERLKQEPFVTIDTEFVREKTYWPELCLVQLGGAHDVAVIDTLAEGLDLSPLADLLDCPSCVKVFHAARQDLEIFLHLFNRLPTSIFDTQVAAMVAGYGDQVGYDSLVSAITGASIDKTHRFSDWSARPLTKAQISYAAADVTHLRNVYLSLHAELEKQERLHWADAEQGLLTNPETFRPDPRKLWERLKARTNNRRMLGVLREIVAWREYEAQQLDIPRQRLIRDESLLEIAAVHPATSDALARVRGVTRGFAEGKAGDGILAAVRTAMALPDNELPRPPRKPDNAKPSTALVALLRVVLAAKCEENRVSPKLVATGDDLDKLALGDKNVAALQGWRRNVFGEDAEALLQGNISLAVDGKNVRLLRRED